MTARDGDGPNYDLIDATITKYRAWQAEGRCYACGEPATCRVFLSWMKPERLYCARHAGEWSAAGYQEFVSWLRVDNGGPT